MARNKQQDEMTRLGFYGLTPFVLSAVALWTSPIVLPQHVALDFHQLSLVYGAVIVAYLSGAGAGVTLTPTQKLRESFLPGQLIALVAFVAIIPDGVLFMWLGAAWRHTIILVLLIYLLMRDMNATSAGLFPNWYGALRLRLTFWAGLSILLIISRLVLWGYY
ncbi:DUF3429 domain-containing protein [Hyphococcus flavus]|uniref:DUF3429 domain-containing protein n=1 Tax=Hyphococcus flavus TaxID=1866326 RepID=A0AAE9ZA21_9PROT|nr:DUF3429 domain-containing protein [Hyphococcus flavus]WDI30309.1 DUF3429 domain-containing protein [Hyphococcus flavus]